jgi:hypothetical protein
MGNIHTVFKAGSINQQAVKRTDTITLNTMEVASDKKDGLYFFGVKKA